MKIFYSWQNDLEGKYNRGFIKDALEKVVRQLNVELSIEEPERQVTLDHDTKGVPGTPDLANTIFEKIAESTVFVADVSFIAERAENNRKLCNPNVLIELGYAFSKLGSDRVVCVMNTAYGEPEDLPFDLKHKRHPVQYSSAGDLKGAKENLVNSLKSAIALIIQQEGYKKRETILSASPSREEILNAVLSSDSKDDWEKQSSTGPKQTIYFKKNVNLRFEMDFDDAGIQNEDFTEKWANKHPDPKATGYWCDLYYASTHIERFILVSVDGGRAMLPMPINPANDLRVEDLDFKVAQIHDTGRLSEYMFRSGLLYSAG